MALIQNYHSIQYLRAVAALMVVASHLDVQLQRLGYTGPWPPGLARGVDLFFVISGFIMVIATRESTPPLAFLARRFLRIAPLYYVLTLLMLTVFAIRPSLLQTFGFDPHHVIASFAFWPWPNPATGLLQPVLIPGWTLNYEMFFYTLFALSMLAGPRRFGVLCAIFLALVALGRLVEGGIAFEFFTAPLILQFLAGVALGHLHQQGRRIPLLVSAVLAPLGLVVLATMPAPSGGDWDALATGAVATVVVAAMVSIEVAGRLPSWRSLLVLGDGSYAIYLIHPPVLSATGQAWRVLGLPRDYFLLGIACMTASVVAGLLGYLMLERPMRLRLRRLTVRPAPATAPLATSPG